MDSGADTRLMTGGFPHSDIPGSKLACQLPEAYRRLLRPSSPPAAKASTVCAYSLDHITPKRRGHKVMLTYNIPIQLLETPLRDGVSRLYDFPICKRTTPRHRRMRSGTSVAGDQLSAKKADLRRRNQPAELVELSGIEPPTPCLQSRCSPS